MFKLLCISNKILSCYYLLKLHHPHSMLVQITVWWYRRPEVNRKTIHYWQLLMWYSWTLFHPTDWGYWGQKGIGFLSAYQQDCGVAPLHYRCWSHSHFRLDIHFQNGRIRKDLIATKFSYFVNSLFFITCHNTRK